VILRPALPADADGMARLLNRIIRIGGTTAYETERSVAQVRDYVDGPAAICCFVAEEAGHVIGFQSLVRMAGLPDGWAEIGTFVDPSRQGRGTGSALFEATKGAARAAGFGVINAAIRADNHAGLGFYASLGFRDHGGDPGFTLRDGRRVGRVYRRFDL